ncbi:MAG: MFS transporter, partial [Verrucomicrobiota bacterium]
ASCSCTFHIYADPLNEQRVSGKRVPLQSFLLVSQASSSLPRTRWTFPMLDGNPALVSHFNHGFAYWIYGVMSILAAWFVWKWVPETKGRSLEQMEKLWTKSAG